MWLSVCSLEIGKALVFLLEHLTLKFLIQLLDFLMALFLSSRSHRIYRRLPRFDIIRHRYILGADGMTFVWLLFSTPLISFDPSTLTWACGVSLIVPGPNIVARSENYSWQNDGDRCMWRHGPKQGNAR